MRMKTIVSFVFCLIVAVGLWAQSNTVLEFSVARVAATFIEEAGQANARAAIKDGIFRHDGSLDIAVNDFTDAALQLVLIRISNEGRPVRLLMGRGGVDPQEETELCRQLNDLFEVRFVEAMGHRFAVVGGQSVVVSSEDWTIEALGSGAQSVMEIDSGVVAQAFGRQFEGLWQTASSTCSDGLSFP